MIALVILATWLTLTASGFVGLSALRRAGAREAADAGSLATSGGIPPVADARASIPRALLQ